MFQKRRVFRLPRIARLGTNPQVRDVFFFGTVDAPADKAGLAIGSLAGLVERLGERPGDLLDFHPFAIALDFDPAIDVRARILEDEELIHRRIDLAAHVGRQTHSRDMGILQRRPTVGIVLILNSEQLDSG